MKEETTPTIEDLAKKYTYKNIEGFGDGLTVNGAINFAEEWASLQAKACGGHWVRASERLPEKEDNYWCKIDDDRYPMIFRDGGFYSLFGKWKPNEYVEWFDEQPSTPTEQDELWDEIIKIVERNEFLSTKYFQAIQELKQSFTITRNESLNKQ